MAKMITLQDSFAVNDLSSLWGQSYGGPSVSGGLCSIPCISAYAGIISTVAYDMTASRMLVRAIPDQGGSSYQLYLRAQLDSTDYIQVGFNGGNLDAELEQGGTSVTLGSTAYSATAHAWWRIRESGGVLYCGVSPDGVNWTDLWSTGYSIAMTAVLATVFSGHYATGTDGTSYAASFNIAPSDGTPWSAPRAGLPGAAAAANRPGQVSQFLASHGITPVYAGKQIVTPAGLGGGTAGIEAVSLGTSDIDQPFAMPSGETAVGRVTLPLLAAGNGADITVSLCADSSGIPGTVIASSRVPGAWLAQLTAPGGPGTGGALATAQSGGAAVSGMTVTSWASPVSSAGSPALPAAAQSGQFLIQAGGQNQAGTGFTSSVFTVGYQGGSAPGTVLPQPPLPAAVGDGALIATADLLIYAGGEPTFTTVTGAVSAAGWSPSSGQVQAWTAQASLPQAVTQPAGAYDPVSGAVYIIGGDTGAGVASPVASVWRTVPVNGQVTGWTACPPLPQPRQGMIAAVVNGWLVAAGGYSATAVWAAPVGAGGVIGGWQQWPPMPASAAAFAVAGSAIAAFGYTTQAVVMTLAVTADGPGQWQVQPLGTMPAGLTNGSAVAAAFPSGTGTWQLIAIDPEDGDYVSGVLTAVPAVSVPLPAAGLTAGATYHIVMHQDGGDLADYVSVLLLPQALADTAQSRPNAGGSWTALAGGYSAIAGVWDQTPGGPVLSTWEDGGARITSMVYGASYGTLLGLCEATAFGDGSMLPAVTQVIYNTAGQPSGLVQLA